MDRLDGRRRSAHLQVLGQRVLSVKYRESERVCFYCRRAFPRADICGKARKGKFMVLRESIKKRQRDKLHELKLELRRRLHDRVPEVGSWLNQVVRGYFQYHGIPMNLRALESFRHQVVRLWCRSLRRRSQKIDAAGNGPSAWQTNTFLFPSPDLCGGHRVTGGPTATNYQTIPMKGSPVRTRIFRDASHHQNRRNKALFADTGTSTPKNPG